MITTSVNKHRLDKLGNNIVENPIPMNCILNKENYILVDNSKGSSQCNCFVEAGQCQKLYFDHRDNLYRGIGHWRY